MEDTWCIINKSYKRKGIKENVEPGQQENLKERKYGCIGGNERKNEMDIFQDFLSDKTGLNFNLKRQGLSTEPARLEPVLRNKRGRDSERPSHCDEEWPPLAATGESPRTETKTQHSHK